MIHKRQYKYLYLFIIIISLVLALITLTYVKDYVGYFGWAVNGTAGYIYEVQIVGPVEMNWWTGYYGIAILSPSNNNDYWPYTSAAGDLNRYDLFFNCHGTTGLDIYASTLNQSQLDFSSGASAANLSAIDAFMEVSSQAVYSANMSFTETINVILGGLNITAPAIDLFPEAVSWLMGALQDSAGNIFFAVQAEEFKQGFDNSYYNYEMMLPIPESSDNITYYFFPDPISDPLSNCSIQEKSFIDGYVTDIRDGSPLNNTIINISGLTTNTNASGYYLILVDVDRHILKASHPGFLDFYGLVEAEVGEIIQYNISMVPDFLGKFDFNAILRGYVFQNTSACIANFSIAACAIPNATVSAGGGVGITNASGRFSFPMQSGNRTAVAVKTGYFPYSKDISIDIYEEKELNLSLIPIPIEADLNGTVNGYVFDEDTLTRISNATVAIGGYLTYSDTNGGFTLNLPASAYYLIIGIKDGYFPYIGNLTGITELVEGGTVNITIPLGEIPEQVQVQPKPEEETQTRTRTRTDESAFPIDVQKPSPLEVFISINEIIKKIQRGNYVDEQFTIFNFRKVPIRLRLGVEGNVAPSIQLSDTELLIPANSSKEVNVRLLGNQDEGKYLGNIRIRGDYDYNIPVYLIITEDIDIPVRTLLMDLRPLKKNAFIGYDFKYELDLINLLIGRKYNVNLSFFISDLNKTNKTPIGEHGLNIETFASLIRSYKIPKDFETGDYLLGVEAEYLGISSSTDTLFSVVYPYHQYRIFGWLPVWVLALIVALLLLGFITYLIIKREMEKRKRFHAKVDYKELPKEGPRSLFVGKIAETTKNAYFDMDILTVHSIVAGSTGGGKSIAAQVIIEEVLIKGAAIVVFDPTAQWSGMLRKCTDKKMLSFYPAMGMKPKDARAFPGNIRAIKDSREIVAIYKNWRPGEIQVFTTSTLDPKDYDIFVANTIREIFHSNLQEYRGLRYMLVYDEIHRILPKFGGSGQGFIQIERGCREFRKWGIGILLISQVLQDFVGQIKANINTNVQMKTRDEGDLNRIKTNYGEEFIQALIKAPVGSGMVQSSAWNRGRPYYVTFRPILHSVVRLSDEELEKYNKFNDIVDDLAFQFEQLEKESQDVFDLKLELKLAQDKIKSGNFNMVQIYLDGLTPRVEKLWNKIGKKPQKLQRKLVDVEAMEKELEAARKEHEKAADKEKEVKKKEVESRKEEKKEETKLSKEQIEANLESITQLGKQIENLLPYKDWLTINDLMMEVKNIALPKDQVEKKDKVVKKLEGAIELTKNPPKGEKKEVKK
ncbi:DUF87 domain-containing protein [Candidatus Woesearchaeota archaeon]|nr:DUF87 domain-containing protein [Candidatus Woesearchaeota archaeon]